ncbi:MAG: GNAT family N-acetyltransferase [Albidovulum sp.]
MKTRAEVLSPEGFAACIDDVARLRIAVFRDWPYLYDGDLDYERRYLATYKSSPNAIVIGAFEGTRLVGAATGTPMEDHGDEFGAAFAETGLDLHDIFYCAESVLLPEYRGRGLGHAFFDLREAKARSIGRRYCAFCRVLRPDDHPMHPPNYRPLDGFWEKRGYAPLFGALAEYAWKDLDEADETAKTMQFWMREL